MIKTTDIFAQTIYEVDYPDFDRIQSTLIDYISTNFNSEFVNEYHHHDHPIRMGALSIIYDSHKFLKEGKELEDENLKSIFNWMTEHGKKYWEILNLSEHLSPHILQLWATAVRRGGFVASHNHNPVPISGVFYLKCEPAQGNLFLENPLDLVLGKSPIKMNERVPVRFNYEVEATSGKLVLFPGWMKHFTRPNPTDELRMSMAVNFGCQGQVFFTEFV